MSETTTTTRPADRRTARRLATTLAAVGVAALSLLGPGGVDPALAVCGPEGCNYEPPADKPHRPGYRPAQVVTIGDSYASGEGAPDRTRWEGGVVWQNANCHRSGYAPAQRAVNLLRATNPYEEGVNFLNVACSGAGIYDGVLNGQAGRGIPSQIAQVNAALGSRTVDILNIGIGGNDLGFDQIVKECIETTCPSSTTRANFDRAMAELPGRYDRLITAVQGDGYGYGRLLQANVKTVFVTKYPSPMRNAGGGYCDRSPWGDPTSGITFDESRWGTDTVLVRLNQAVEAMVARANARPGVHPQWVLVPAPDFNRHGFCAGDGRWIGTTGDSLNDQGDIYGTMHPNRAGTGELGRNLYGHWKYINA